MAKVVRNLRPTQAEFQKIFSGLCNTKSAWQVWSDFVEAAAIAISNATELRGPVAKAREERYTQIMKGYTKQEREIFPELLACVTMALENNPDQDFLGELFMALELGSHWKGQFFTPYDICRMMAEVNMGDLSDKMEEKGWVGINDPACGAGATLIAARNMLARRGMDWTTQALFIAQDIDRTAALMCFIQLSLLGCAGYVVIADSLIYPISGSALIPKFLPEHDVWFMPCLFLTPEWTLRTMRERRGAVAPPVPCETCEAVEEKAEAKVKKAPEITKTDAPQEAEDNEAYVQLSFF